MNAKTKAQVALFIKNKKIAKIEAFLRKNKVTEYILQDDLSVTLKTPATFEIPSFMTVNTTKTKATKAPKEPKAIVEKAPKAPKEPKAKVEKPAKAPHVTPQTITILSALYGIKGVNTIDVTDKATIGAKITNKIIGSDPVKNKKKKVYVTAILDGVETETVFNEGKELIWA